MKKLIFLALIGVFTLEARMVDVWVEGGPKSVYTAGEPVRIHVISKVDGYLYLYNIDPNGRAKLIFPLGRPVYIHAGVHYVLPDDFYYDVEWNASYEPGVEYIYAVVVPYPIYEMPEYVFEPLPPDAYIHYEYDDIEFAVVFRFRPPFWFPRVYFGAWTSYYVIPRYYVYRPAPWYCYDCHHPGVFISFYFDFCPLYEIRVYEYRYVYIPRYVKYVPRRYRVRTVWRFEKKITPEKRVRLRKVEKETRIRLREKGVVEGKPVRELIVKKRRTEYYKEPIKRIKSGKPREKVKYEKSKVRKSYTEPEKRKGEEYPVKEKKEVERKKERSFKHEKEKKYEEKEKKRYKNKNYEQKEYKKEKSEYRKRKRSHREYEGRYRKKDAEFKSRSLQKRPSVSENKIRTKRIRR